MRTFHLAVALLLAATVVTLAAPAADAWTECNGIDQPWCPGLVCIDSTGNAEPCDVVFVPYP